MNSIKKLSAIIAVMLLLVPCLGIFTLAFNVDTNREISFKITDIPIANIKFFAYRVASLDTNGTLTADENFASVDMDLNGDLDYSVLSDTLFQKVLSDRINPDSTVLSNEDGTALFDSSTIKAGLYLITSEKIMMDENVYGISPFMVILPFKYDGGTAYDVIADAKFDIMPTVSVYTVSKVWDDDGAEGKRPTKIDIVLYCDGEIYDEISLPHNGKWRYNWFDLPSDHTWWVEEKTITDYKATVEQNGTAFVITNTYTGNVQPPEDIPTTGQLWWPVPVLTCIGLLFISLGIVTRTKAK